MPRRRTSSRRSTRTTRRSTARRTYSRRSSPRRATRRVSARRSSSRGGTFKLIIQQAPAVPLVNPLTAPLMATKKPEPGPKKAKF